jgi:hypothetical protein
VLWMMCRFDAVVVRCLCDGCEFGMDDIAAMVCVESFRAILLDSLPMDWRLLMIVDRSERNEGSRVR